MFDVVVIGSGAAGMMAAISAKKNEHSTLLLEKLPKLGQKLKATGGGKCNITNTLSNEEFMVCFGKDGRFMSEALNSFSHKELLSFLSSIGVECESRDGKRYFPKSRSSQTIIDALEAHMKELEIEVKCNQNVSNIRQNSKKIYEIHTNKQIYLSKNIIIATGGLGYQSLGTTGDGYEFAKSFGHKISQLSPAMMPLSVKQTWVANARADTLPKVQMHINIPKYKKLKATGDLIFTKDGIRGPIVLDFAREVTPLLNKFNEVPLIVSLTGGLNEEQIRLHIKSQFQKHPHKNIVELCNSLLPASVIKELCKIVDIDISSTFKALQGSKRDELIKLLAWTPLDVIGPRSFDKAMITRGGVSLKEINPKTMQSKLQEGLYFCGEVVDLDGPCGGFNLQWSFASGHLAGKLNSGKMI